MELQESVTLTECWGWAAAGEKCWSPPVFVFLYQSASTLRKTPPPLHAIIISLPSMRGDFGGWGGGVGGLA